ncbi:MAG TPA: integrase arm-type DNA-binding domain-containing protein [Terriglobales bacterium]
MALTDTGIRALTPRRARYLVTDGRGLCLEVFPSGKFSWLFRYRFKGRPEKVSLGRYPDLSLKAARCERDKQATLLAGGRSPAEEKRLAKMALTRDCTVREFSERYYHDIVLRDRKDPSDMRRYLDNEIIPALGQKPLSQVMAADVQTLVFRKRDNGKESAAAQIRSLIKRIFDYAVVCGVAQANPAMALPTRFITKVRPRTRVLTPDEVRVYLHTLYRSNIRRQFKLALHLILLTLVRKAELLLAQWKDVDLEGGEWKIPAENSKTEQPHTVYLSTQATELFQELKALAGGSVWVMPGRSGLSKPFSHNAMNQAMGSITFEIPPFTIHDLRRTGSTLLHGKGFASDVIEKSLNHQIKEVRGVYNRAEYAEQRRQMLQFWADYVEDLATEKEILVANFG